MLTFFILYNVNSIIIQNANFITQLKIILTMLQNVNFHSQQNVNFLIIYCSTNYISQQKIVHALLILMFNYHLYNKIAA